MWYAYLLQYLEVLCQRIVTLPRAAFKFFILSFLQHLVLALNIAVISSQNDSKLGMHVCFNFTEYNNST